MSTCIRIYYRDDIAKHDKQAFNDNVIKGLYSILLVHLEVVSRLTNDIAKDSMRCPLILEHNIFSEVSLALELMKIKLIYAIE